MFKKWRRRLQLEEKGNEASHLVRRRRVSCEVSPTVLLQDIDRCPPETVDYAVTPLNRSTGRSGHAAARRILMKYIMRENYAKARATSGGCPQLDEDGTKCTNTKDDKRNNSSEDGYGSEQIKYVLSLLQMGNVILERAPDRLRLLRTERNSERSFAAASSENKFMVLDKVRRNHRLEEEKEEQEQLHVKLEADLEEVGSLLIQASDKLAAMLVEVCRRDDEMEGGTYKVFLSHAGEDKTAIAVPIWGKLRMRGIRSFLDKEELRSGENANDAMQHAMDTSPIGVFILSTEFAAKKWTMKELMCFLERVRKAKERGEKPPLLIPVFYRLGLNEWQDQDLFRRSQFATCGFLERLAAGEASIDGVRESLRALSRHTGVENLEGATNRGDAYMAVRRERIVDCVVQKIVQALEI